MVSRAVLHTTDRSWSARHWWLLMLLLSVAGVAMAGVFDTPIAGSDFDTANFSQYVDGSTTAITAVTPTDIAWTLTTVPPDSKELVFGDTKNAGIRHARIAFGTSNAKTLGAILVRGDVKVSILKSTATYPGNLANDVDWTACERLNYKTVTTSERTVTDVSSRYPGYTVWVVPSAATATKAVRFTHTAAQSDSLYAGHVRGVYFMNARYANLGAQAYATASLNPTAAQRILNEYDDDKSVWNPYETTPRWDSGTPATPISATNPVTLMIVWPSNVTVRGICALGAAFQSADIEMHTGTVQPREAPDSAWTPIAQMAGVQENPNKYLAPNFVDFGANKTTRALRIKIYGASGAGNAAISEFLALKAMTTSALSTAVVTETKTNPPIPVTFTLASAGYVSLVINDAGGNRIRNLVKEQYFPAGSNTVYWDGLDESQQYDAAFWGYHTAGKLVAPGTYSATGVWRNALTLTYEFSPFTGGNPAWFNRDETGGWTADHNPPCGAVYLPSIQQVMFSSPVVEQGNGLAWVDLNGQLKYGTRSFGEGGYWHGADLLARDVGGSPESGIESYFVNHGGGKSMELWAVTTGKSAGRRYTFTYDAGLTLDTNKPIYGGLAVRNQLAAVSFTQTNQIALIRTADGHEYNKVTINDARGLAFDSNGKLIVLTGTSLLRYAVPTPSDGMTLTLEATLVTGLTDARGLCLDSNNDMYASVWGSAHQVRVYNSAGAFQRAIGTANTGTPSGLYDNTKMSAPWGLAISDNAGTKRLWVAEYSWTMKRISVWTLTGTLDTALTKHGPPAWGTGMTIDPTDKNHCYYVGWNFGTTVDLSLNWTNGTWSVYRVMDKTTTGQVDIPGSSPQTPIYANGNQLYMTNAINTNPTGGIDVAGVWKVVNNQLVPVAASGNAHSWALLKTSTYDARWTTYGLDKTNTGVPVFFAWTDTDNDQQLDASELTLKNVTGGMSGSVYYDRDLSVLTRSGIHVAPSGFTAAGAPIYDAATATTLASIPYSCGIADGGCETFEAANNWIVATSAPIMGYQSGTKKWTYPNEWMGMEAEARWGMPLGNAGDIMALTRNCGQPVQANASVGEIFAMNSAEGQVYLMTTDGIFLATLFKDRRTIPTWNWMKLSSWGCYTATRGMDVSDVCNGISSFFTTFNKTSDGIFYLSGGLEHSSIARVN